jgi:hypothetical protein
MGQFGFLIIKLHKAVPHNKSSKVVTHEDQALSEIICSDVTADLGLLIVS